MPYMVPVAVRSSSPRRAPGASRSGFDRLCTAATRRELDIVMAGSVDRLGRSLHDLVGFLREVQAPGIDPYLHHQAIDTTSPAGKALSQMPGVFAGFGREMIRSNSP